jgi:glycosyltransferase involved in cell wall biosynthesis
MKILSLIHSYPPITNAGAEMYVKNLFDYLVEKGHKVVVRMAVSELDPYELDGVKVDIDSFKKTHAELQDTDLIITHLNRAGYALNLAEFRKKPLVVIHHNPNGFAPAKGKHQEDMNNRWVYNIYNSEHVRKAVNYPNPYYILRPPVMADRVKVSKKGNKVTLVNLWEDKGGELFAQLARTLTDRKFLGVKGGYARQKQVLVDLPNMEILENTSDMKRVFGKTRVLLMPSLRESWGMVGVEAMASGIPVVAHPTPGLKEMLGDAGIFCDRNKPQEWIDILAKLDDEAFYKEASAKATKRFKELQEVQKTEMSGIIEWLDKAIKKQL